jgi:tetratricopeptide (TPR) repeat protein
MADSGSSARSEIAPLQLAARLRQVGRLADSLAPMERAAQIHPSDPIIQHDLGLTYLNLERAEEAAQCFRRATVLKSDFAHAHYRLGIALELQGRSEDAIACYQRAVALTSSLADAQSRLGGLYASRGRNKEAADAFRAAAATAADAAEGRIALIRALLVEGKDVEAEMATRRLLAQSPHTSVGRWTLGTILAEAGRFEEAFNEFNQSIILNPQHGLAYYDLVRCRTIVEADWPLIERMLEVSRSLHEPETLAPLHLAIGKAFEDLKDYSRAMVHFMEANRIKSTVATLDHDSFARRIDETIALFTPAFVATHAEAGNASELPVMILGMPRSGTTLIEQIVSSHPQVVGAGELPFWTGRTEEFWQTRGGNVREFQLQAADDYIEHLRGVAPTVQRVTDKMPFNFLRAGLIHLVFPRATVIHCRRHPVDTCLSISSTYFAPRRNFSSAPIDLVFYYKQYLRLMAHWRAVLPMDRFIEVDYEALIADPERISRMLIAGCGLEWDPACLRPEHNSRAVRTASKWQIRQPIQNSAVARWRRFEPWLGAFRELLTEGHA